MILGFRLSSIFVLAILIGCGSNESKQTDSSSGLSYEKLTCPRPREDAVIKNFKSLEAPDETIVAPLVKNLGSPKFKERDDASRQLRKYDIVLLKSPSFTNAFGLTDAEVRFRVEEIRRTVMMKHRAGFMQYIADVSMKALQNNVEVLTASRKKIYEKFLTRLDEKLHDVKLTKDRIEYYSNYLEYIKNGNYKAAANSFPDQYSTNLEVKTTEILKKIFDELHDAGLVKTIDKKISFDNTIRFSFDAKNWGSFSPGGIVWIHNEDKESAYEYTAVEALQTFHASPFTLKDAYAFTPCIEGDPIHTFSLRMSYLERNYWYQYGGFKGDSAQWKVEYQFYQRLDTREHGFQMVNALKAPEYKYINVENRNLISIQARIYEAMLEKIK